VSAAKFARADKSLAEGRANGKTANGMSFSVSFVLLTSAALFEKNNIEGEAAADKQVLVVVSSDRGLCGGIHSGIVKATKLALKETPAVCDLVLRG
jgi:F-type H+-transporting ATPase subunit gamma